MNLYALISAVVFVIVFSWLVIRAYKRLQAFIWEQKVRRRQEQIEHQGRMQRLFDSEQGNALPEVVVFLSAIGLASCVLIWLLT